ncbi:MAG TPA: hypothetical protein VH281_02165 [Gaiellaceae bacterium]
MATLTKPLLLAVAALAAFFVLYPAAREHLPSIDRLGSRSSSSESASQLSPEEFATVGVGFTPTRLRSFAGDPASKTDASVESIDLECWYYGIAGARGAFQICFENGRFSTKTRFDRSDLSS